MTTPLDLLARVKAEVDTYGFNECMRELQAVDDATASGRPLRVAALRTYTAGPLEPVLRLRLLLDGFRPAFWLGGYNQYAQEILDEASGLYQFQPDVVLLLIRLEEVAPAFVDAFSSASAGEWERRLRAAAEDIGGLVDHLRARCSAPVIVQGFSLARPPYAGALDAQRPGGQQQLVANFNDSLGAVAAARDGMFVWDFDALVRARGYEQLHDAKMWYVSRNPYRQGAYPWLAADLARTIGAALGRVRKCVVVDLDNTLWGGVVGEDGVEGIALGRAYPGNCYRDFQKGLLALLDRGILLAINSKNNEEDALRVLDTHPDMVLRREHFAAMRINWQDKASNLRALAQELNIGFDSMTVVDDNPAECDLIRRECPECDVVLLPDKPYLLPSLPGRLRGIDNLRVTAEDRAKTSMYRARAAREAQASQYSNMDDFLRSLEIEVAAAPADSFSIPRIAQLTQKTNQMNMTGRRYTDAEIRVLASDHACAVYSIASRDRFGDEGIVGVFILKFRALECHIDTFLLSCRVIGRGIEDAMIALIGDLCTARGVHTLTAEFIPSGRNQPAAGFYERVGLKRIDETLLQAQLPHHQFSYPAHVAIAHALAPMTTAQP